MRRKFFSVARKAAATQRRDPPSNYRWLQARRLDEGSLANDGNPDDMHLVTTCFRDLPVNPPAGKKVAKVRSQAWIALEAPSVGRFILVEPGKPLAGFLQFGISLGVAETNK